LSARTNRSTPPLPWMTAGNWHGKGCRFGVGIDARSGPSGRVQQVLGNMAVAFYHEIIKRLKVSNKHWGIKIHSFGRKLE
jgi:hypothetical protein